MTRVRTASCDTRVNLERCARVKAPLRPFEYMAWAKSVPRGARYDLTASGVSDVVDDPEVFDDERAARWSEGLDVRSCGRRGEAEAGARELTEAVASRYDIDPSCVTPTLGSSTAITQVLMALVRSGDHVVVERPTYEALRRAPEILGAMVSRLERKLDEGWAVVPERLAQLLTPRTRAVILSNLHNPTGVAIDAKSLHAIAELAARVGAMVLVDEVYLDYVWPRSGGTIAPAVTLARNTVCWSSASKAFGVWAARAGWIVTPDPDAARAIRAASDYLHLVPPVGASRLGARVLGDAEALVARSQARAEAGRKVVESWISGQARLAWVPPAGGLSGFVRLPSFMQDVAFCEHLRQSYDTQLVPGTMFEMPGFVRLSFGLEPSALEVALGHVTSALDDLTR